MSGSGKIAVSLPRALIEDARRAVAEGRSASVSAHVADALSRYQREEVLSALVAELVATHGEPTPADYAWADEVLGVAP